ncbi:hypothetical protein KTS45_13395 [Halomicroarcula limicola]|uniref:DUF7847 domain-containing protein n=1 Tax=Haloarcula limicola TaxID=1429915 RepID=A0A8J7YBJ4_9EURY|nr:hypothetical protein [Halomicroarcula limicola]MBV0925194.1 hypothetical protein [Halomicroarcula limicola]
MSLQIGSSLTGGFDRVANRNGVVLTLAYVVLGIIWQVAFYSAFLTLLQRSGDLPADATQALPALDLPLAASASVSVISLLLLQVMSIVAIRTFVGGHSSSIPSEYYTRNIVLALVNTILGGFVYSLLVFVGTLLFVIPGIIAYVAFLFMMYYVAVKDDNFVAALRNSWTLTRGNWIPLVVILFVIFVVLAIVPGILSVLASAVVSAVAGPAIGTLTAGVVTLPFSLIVLGILSEAFVQLRESEETANV